MSTLSDNSKLQHAPSIRSCKLWCQARTFLAPVPLVTKMSASKLIHYFSSHAAAFRFWSLIPPDNITSSSANRKADQSLCDLQTVVGAAAHATLDTQQLISHLRVPFLILLPLCLILREVLSLCVKCVIDFSRFMTFWTWLFSNKLGTLLVC